MDATSIMTEVLEHLQALDSVAQVTALASGEVHAEGSVVTQGGTVYRVTVERS